MPAAAGTDLDVSLLVESLPEIVWANLPDGRTVFLNRAGMERTGFERDENGQFPPWLQAVHPDDAATGLQSWQDAVASGGGITQEFRLRLADGSYRWAVVRAEPVAGPSGEVACWVGVCTDIDALKLAERRYAESAALIDASQAAVPIGFGFVDREFRFLRVNETLAAIDGLPASDHIGRPVAEVVPTLWPQLEPIYRQVLDGATLREVEITGETPAAPGELRTWAVSYYPVRLADESLGIGIIARDITAEKHLEAERARAAEARGALLAATLRAQDDERRRITGELHDECIPRVAAARMEVEALRSRLDDADARVLVDRLEGGLHWMLQRLRELIFELRPPSLDRGLEAALSDHLAQVGANAGARTRFDYRLVAEPPQDTTELIFRIAREALANVQAHADPSLIELAVEEVEGGVCLRVTDDGVGFDPDALGQRPGHVGLELMRERAELGGGRITIASRPGEGTHIDVWLPANAHL